MEQPALAIADVVRALEAAMTLIPLESRAHPAAVLGQRPAPEAWSATECVAHVIDSERHGFNGGVNGILAADDVVWPGGDGPPPKDEAGRRRDAEDLTAEFLTLRPDSIRLVRGSTEQALERSGRILGNPPTVGAVLRAWTGHDRGHFRQMAASTEVGHEIEAGRAAVGGRPLPVT